MFGSALLVAILVNSILVQDLPALARDRVPPELAALSDEELGRIARMSPLPPLAPDPTNRVADDENAARLGHRLFFDTRLSPKEISCATCHEPARTFTDGKKLAQGIGTTRRNTPTVLDAARRRWTGWDGKFDSLWSQALAPIENPAEMGGDRTTLVRVVRDDVELRKLYELVFGPFPAALCASANDPLHSPTPRDAALQSLIDRTTADLLKAFGAYQRKLISGRAPIDRFVEELRSKQPVTTTAKIDALTPAARRGLAIFVSQGGCYQCHRGANFTDEEFHALGLAGANGRVPDDPARLAAVDFVQTNPFNAAGSFSDAPNAPKAAMVRGLRRFPELFGQFRTPSLRGVARTKPYMHDGRMADLSAVATFYDTLEGASPTGHHGELVLMPLGLGAEGRSDLVAFLEALTPDESKLGVWEVDPIAPSVRRSASTLGR